MPSAFAAFQNATATFKMAGQGIVTDPDTGNVSPVIDELVVQLFLKAEKLSPRRAGDTAPVVLPGVALEETLFKGYAVSPQYLPEGLVVGTTGSLVFAGKPAVECLVVEVGGATGTEGTLGAILTNTLGTAITLVAQGQM